jgi:hypothetical protein
VSNSSHFLAVFLVLSPSAVIAAGDCPNAPPSDIRDNALYFLDQSGDGAWKLVRGHGPIEKSDGLIFAYGIRDKRTTSGMTLFKVANLKDGQQLKDRKVQLSRNSVSRYGRQGRTKTVEEWRGAVDARAYHDIHLNSSRDINKPLSKFHSAYAYRDGENRDTFDARRRSTFAFDQVKPIEQPRSFWTHLFGPKALADISSDGVTSLRATLKYYAAIDTLNGTAICFTLSPDQLAERSKITAVDLNYAGYLPDDRERLKGRQNHWTIRWKRPASDMDEQ